MKAHAFVARVNLVTLVRKSRTFPAGRESLELGQKPTKKLLAYSASKGTNQ